ncbi:MAG TPA: hypothetical protein VGG06_30030 [Thermoanaerobaculia bacterium]|jgi:hypothetical protein
MKRQYSTLFSIIAVLLTAVCAVGAQESEPAALVVTGTAVNASPEEIIVKTETGEEIFLIEKENLYPEPIAEGATVTVWYVERGGYHYATKVEVGEPIASTSEVDADLAAADPMATDEGTTGDTYDDTYGADDTLPGTASSRPLLALLGLLASLGAAVVWQIRK